MKLHQVLIMLFHLLCVRTHYVDHKNKYVKRVFVKVKYVKNVVFEIIQNN